MDSRVENFTYENELHPEAIYETMFPCKTGQ